MHRRRGGYCYEHNGLMGYRLAEMGFGVERFAGRVVWMMSPSDALPAQTHEALSVTCAGARRPLARRRRIRRADVVVADPARGRHGASHPPRALPAQEHGEDLVLETKVRDEWQPLYMFATQPRPQIDLEVGSWYVSTYPESTS